MCVRSLVEEIGFSGGLLAAEEAGTDSTAPAGHLTMVLGKKPGRGFCHKETKLYMNDSGTVGNKCKLPVMIRQATAHNTI